MTNFKIFQDKISSLPNQPGVYIFKDARGQILYIGKAKSLKKRVQSYFSSLLNSKTRAFVSKIKDVEYILTPNEPQAQVLEAVLIKDNQPYYNVSLKDDKSFPLIRISHEEFPVICVCRKKRQVNSDLSAYFGPYTNAGQLRQALKFIRSIFGFRSCKVMPKKACLYSRLGLCSAPCVGRVTSLEYKEVINQISLFLESKYEKLLDKLALKMKEASVSRDFEEAVKYRDQINALSIFKNEASSRRKQGSFQSGILEYPSSIRVLKDASVLPRKYKSHVTSSFLEEELTGLKNLLGLDKIPQRIEAFDISNISGKDATGAMVSFYKGVPDKNNYRRFRIKTVKSIDDYGMLKEVVMRRYAGLKRENACIPDVVLIDGGLSHLKAASGEIRKLGLNIPLISIAKEHENIYVLGRSAPFRLKEDFPVLNFIRRIRDEAHRFALAYHHVLRRKEMIGK